MASSLRHTFHTKHNLVDLSDHWAFSDDAFTLHKFEGTYEARLRVPLEPQVLDVLKGVRSLQLTYRTENVLLGDLFYTDLFDGLTIQLRHHETVRKEETAFQGYKLLEVMTGQQLETPDGKKALFAVRGVELFFNATAAPAPFQSYLSTSFPDLQALIEAATFVQMEMDCDEQYITVRTIQSIAASDETVVARHLESNPQVWPELGIVHRQRRDLPDSEFRGLSAFLKSRQGATDTKDLTPFTIFFDQRVQPHGRSSIRYRSSLYGAGSHLTLKTEFLNSQPFAKHMSQLEKQGCSTHALYQLPKAYFFDTFELQASMPDMWHIYGEDDLEAPVWSTSSWGSLAVADLPLSSPLEVKVPIHARYMSPNQGGHNQSVTLPAPKVFSRCPQPDAAFDDNPFDTTTLLTALLGDSHQFRFYHDVGASQFQAQIAVADADGLSRVTVGTLGVVLLGTLWVLWSCCSKSTLKKKKKKV